jgi:hypothetical protein
MRNGSTGKLGKSSEAALAEGETTIYSMDTVGFDL